MSGSLSLHYLLARGLLVVLVFLLVRPGMFATRDRRRRHSSVLRHVCAFGCLAAALLILGSTVFASANVGAYVVHATLKVRPDDAPLDAIAIDIAAARNEFESFQVVVHAGGTDMRNVRVTATLTGIPAQNRFRPHLSPHFSASTRNGTRRTEAPKVACSLQVVILPDGGSVLGS